MTPERLQEIRDWASTEPIGISDRMLREVLLELDRVRAKLAVAER